VRKKPFSAVPNSAPDVGDYKGPVAASTTAGPVNASVAVDSFLAEMEALSSDM